MIIIIHGEMSLNEKQNGGNNTLEYVTREKDAKPYDQVNQIPVPGNVSDRRCLNVCHHDDFRSPHARTRFLPSPQRIRLRRCRRPVNGSHSDRLIFATDAFVRLSVSDTTYPSESGFAETV